MLGFIGGTGPEGRGLALRFAMAGEQVLLGSRDESRARQALGSIGESVPKDLLRGGLNRAVAREADIVFIVVPYAGHRDTLSAMKEELDGKIVVDTVAPLAFSKGQARAIPVQDGSAALEAQSILPNSYIVAALHTISAHDLLVPSEPVNSDVVVCADNQEARVTIMKLVEKIEGVRAVNGGGLNNARYIEDFAALLLNINRIYRARSKIKIVGI